jgi:hypothetical protein
MLRIAPLVALAACTVADGDLLDSTPIRAVTLEASPTSSSGGPPRSPAPSTSGSPRPTRCR